MFAKRRGSVLAIAILLFLVIGYLAIGRVLGSCLFVTLDTIESICSIGVAAEWNIQKYDQCMTDAGPIDIGWDRAKVEQAAGRWERSISTSPFSQSWMARSTAVDPDRFRREVEQRQIVQYFCWRPDGPSGEESDSGFGTRLLLRFDTDDKVTALGRGDFRWGRPPGD